MAIFVQINMVYNLLSDQSYYYVIVYYVQPHCVVLWYIVLIPHKYAILNYQIYSIEAMIKFMFNRLGSDTNAQKLNCTNHNRHYY